jgi:hypothetical protein
MATSSLAPPDGRSSAAAASRQPPRVAHGGTRALLTTGRTAAWNGPRQTVTSVLTNGRSYTTNVWVRTQSGSGDGIKVTLQLTANGTTSYVTLAPAAAANSSGWTLLTGTATVSWTGTLTSASVYRRDRHVGHQQLPDRRRVLQVAPGLPIKELVGPPQLEAQCEPP